MQTVSLDMKKIIIRPLTASDSVAYRALKKRILDIGDGKYFNTEYTRDHTFTTEEHWRDWCTETHDHCTIGTFYDGNLIGIMGIVRYGSPDDSTVEWESTWLEPEYRKHGIAKLAYEKVYQWTKEHGYKYAVMLIRDENTRSRAIREKQGAVYMKTQHNEVWADGSIGSFNVFILDIMRAEKENIQANAIKQLSAIFESFGHEPTAEHNNAITM